MTTSDKWIVQLTIDQGVAHGIIHWVFSPGSRNAPLALSADLHPAIETFVIHDERSAGFFALGLAEKTGKPVALCCTSGSALANYLPAVTEAYYRSIPLWIISADRPSAWTDQGDGQTLRQQHLFQGFVHRFVHLEDCSVMEDYLWPYQRETALMMHALVHEGPVHLNLGLSEPLYQTTEKIQHFHRSISIHRNHEPNPKTIEELAALMRGKKILVLCGQMAEHVGLLEALEQFATLPNVAVLTENISNLPSEFFNACIDRSLNALPESTIEHYQPEVLLSLGGAVVSKRIKAWLRKVNLLAHVRIGLAFTEMDTYQQLTHSMVCEPVAFFRKLYEAGIEKTSFDYRSKWKQIDYLTKDKFNQFKVSSAHLTDFHGYQSFFSWVPEGTVIHLANSSVIRYAQLFDPIKGCTYFANRGTSGIDGSMSTALGYASQDDRLNILIIGDISFLYDSNALQLKALAPRLKILLMNNHGGGIFRIIDGAKDAAQCPKYLEAAHPHNGSLAEAFGWKYKMIDDITHLDSVMHQFLVTDSIDCLELNTHSEASSSAFKDIYTFVS